MITINKSQKITNYDYLRMAWSSNSTAFLFATVKFIIVFSASLHALLFQWPCCLNRFVVWNCAYSFICVRFNKPCLLINIRSSCDDERLCGCRVSALERRVLHASTSSVGSSRLQQDVPHGKRPPRADWRRAVSVRRSLITTRRFYISFVAFW